MQSLVVFSLFLAAALSIAPLYNKNEPTRIVGQYHVIFNETVPEAARKLFVSSYAAEVMHSFDIGDFHGFAVHLSEDRLMKTLMSPFVKYVEPVMEVHAVQSCIEQKDATWGLDRISERDVNLDEVYHYGATAGSGVQSFIIDTGIETRHVDFGGRAVWSVNYVDNQNVDCNGHGTHVAGTVGGQVYGVAKKTTLFAVKVLSCAGSGTNAGVIRGIEYVAANKNGKPSLANMSLGGGMSKATNDAVDAAVNKGIVMVVAAGNSNADACLYSPASAPLAISVGATTIDGNDMDIRTSFSNYGTCVDILAPGELVTSDWIGADPSGRYVAIRTISGTSMAAPHVAGVAALFLANNPNATPKQVLDFLNGQASEGIINMLCNNNVCRQTPNLMLFSPC